MKTIGISFGDSKIYFCVIENNIIDNDKITPLDIAISFDDRLPLFSTKALHSKHCVCQLDECDIVNHLNQMNTLYQTQHNYHNKLQFEYGFY